MSWPPPVPLRAALFSPACIRIKTESWASSTRTGSTTAQGLTTFIHALKGKGYECGLTYKTGVKPNPPFDFKPSYKQNRLTGEDSDHLVNNSVDNFRFFLQHLKEGTPFYFQAQTPDTHSTWHRPEFIKPGSEGWPYPDVDLAKVQPFDWLGDDFPMSEKFRREVGTYYRAIQRVDWFVGRDSRVA